MLHTSVPTSEGTAGVLLTYVRDQVERGWSVTVACPSEGWLGYSARELGAEVRWFDAAREPGPSVAEEVGRYARLVADVEPDGQPFVASEHEPDQESNRTPNEVADGRALDVADHRGTDRVAVGASDARANRVAIERADGVAHRCRVQ